MSSAVQARVRAVFKGTEFLHADVDGLAADADLCAAGLNSDATVNLMLALEEACRAARLLAAPAHLDLAPLEADYDLIMTALTTRFA